ncbi:MAG TPA: spherulation-specific family 4 protein [Nitrososphaerales archaeon]|nr:spherulation-specific family 4 protein [Nitrososphaerales archaeon]
MIVNQRKWGRAGRVYIYSIIFLVGIGAVVVSTMVFQTIFGPPTGPLYHTSKTGVIIPLYTDPDNSWNGVVQVKKTYPQVPMAVIINPNNGPGSNQDPSYVNGVESLQRAGITVLGYVATGYGSRDINSIKSEIGEYKQWYNVNGIFFDEMAYTAGFENFYSQLNSYAISLGLKTTIGNPGTDTLQSYFGTVGTIVIYENPGYPQLSTLTADYSGTTKNDFAIIVTGVSAPTQSFITEATQYVSYLYVTNGTAPNPFDSVTPYLGGLAFMLNNTIAK